MRLIYMIGYVVVTVLAGIFTKSIWVGFLVAGGFFFLYGPTTNSIGGLFLRIFVGLGLLGLAAWISQFAGPWLWTAICLLAAITASMIGSASKLNLVRWLSPVKMILSVLLIILAVISPFLIIGNFASEGFLVWLFLSFLLLVGSFFLFTLKFAKQQHEALKHATWIGLLLVVGVAAMGGFASNVIWVPFLVTPGLLLLFKNFRRWIEGAVFNWKMHLLPILGGIACLIAGTILGNFQTWWYWTVIWVAASLPLFVMGSFMFGEKQTDRSVFLVGVFSVVLGVCALVFALTGYFILKDLEMVSAVITYILITAGLLVLIISWNYSTTNSNFLAVLMGIIGTLLLLGAQVYTQFPEGWIWIVLWALGMLLMLAGVLFVRSFITKILMALIAVLHLLIILFNRRVYENLIAGEKALNLTQYVIPILIVLGSLVLLAVLVFSIFMMIRLRAVKKAAEQFRMTDEGIRIGELAKLMFEEADKGKKK